jgi:hypothetical protein
MAESFRVYGTSAVTHRCVLHDDERIKVCSGTLKKGGNCANRAADASTPGMMPTCRIHRDQLKVSGWCRALLPCGFECGRIFEWKPHGFQRCPGHRKTLTTCYFLNMPKEMRLRVYQFLLPDGPIPAQYRNSRDLTTDGEGVCTAILRVNKLIHAEAADLLYSTRLFTIELSGNGLRMCNSVSPFRRHRFPDNGGISALQDYQMQLMLLEQQNKRRLLMARREQDNITGGSSLTCTSAIYQQPYRTRTPCTYRPIETLWHPPLSDRCFNMIRSFLIKFVFPPEGDPYFASHRAHGSSNPDASIHKILESRLYDYCDHLHRLIERLQLIHRPIAHLDIIIKFGDTYVKQEEAFSAAQLLLRPFRRLYNVAKPNVLSITMNHFQGYEAELVVPDRISCTEEDGTFTDYLKCWTRDLSSSQPSCGSPQIFKAYRKLEELLSNVKEHCYHAEPTFSQFTDLLHSAKVAREAEDLTHFKKIWDQVVNIWFGYLNERDNFQSNVARSIDAIYDLVGNGSEASGPVSAELKGLD